MKLTIATDEMDFTQKPTLNSDFWTDEKLNPEVRDAIMAVVESFLESTNLEIGVDDIDEIEFTGSLANYNYSKFSDVDIHLLFDFSKLGKDPDFMRELLTSKAIIWNNKHNVTLFGHEVELYITAAGTDHHSTGVYSVKNDEWLVKPVRDPKLSAELNLNKVKDKADKISKEIDMLVVKDEVPFEKIEKVKDKIKKMRIAGLETGGEFSTENLAFKLLRRRGELSTLSALMQQAKDAELSLDEDMEWWKKRRHIDNKNYRELMGYVGDKGVFKRKYAAKNIGYPKSVSRKKLSKMGPPYTMDPQMKLPKSAPPGVFEAIGADSMMDQIKNKVDRGEFLDYPEALALLNLGLEVSMFLRGANASRVIKCLNQHRYVIRKEGDQYKLDFVDKVQDYITDQIKTINFTKKEIDVEDQCLLFDGKETRLYKPQLDDVVSDEIAAKNLLGFKANKKAAALIRNLAAEKNYVARKLEKIYIHNPGSENNRIAGPFFWIGSNKSDPNKIYVKYPGRPEEEVRGIDLGRSNSKIIVADRKSKVIFPKTSDGKMQEVVMIGYLKDDKDTLFIKFPKQTDQQALKLPRETDKYEILDPESVSTAPPEYDLKRGEVVYIYDPKEQEVLGPYSVVKVDPKEGVIIADRMSNIPLGFFRQDEDFLVLKKIVYLEDKTNKESLPVGPYLVIKEIDKDNVVLYELEEEPNGKFATIPGTKPFTANLSELGERMISPKEAAEFKPQEDVKPVEGEVSAVPGLSGVAKKKAEWAAKTYNIAKKELTKKYGDIMPILVTIVGALESHWGQKGIGHNYFGIKQRTKNGKCPGIMARTTEVARNKRSGRKSCFRKFDSLEDGVRGYAELLQRERYVDAFKLFPNDPAFAVAWIWINGYASGNKYVDSVMGVAKTVYRYTGSDKFKLDYPNDLKKAVDVLEDDITMEKYALSSTEIPKSKRKRYKRIIRRAKTLPAGSIKRKNEIMKVTDAGRRHLGKKLIARAYAISEEGKTPLEAQKYAEKVARMGFDRLTSPMPNDRQIAANSIKARNVLGEKPTQQEIAAMVDPDSPPSPLPKPTPTKPDSEPETTDAEDLSGEEYITIAENEIEFFTLNGKEGGLKEWMPNSWERIAEYWEKAGRKDLVQRTKDGIEYGFPYVLSKSLGRQFTKIVKDRDGREREVNVTLLRKYGNGALPKKYYTDNNSWKKFFSFYNLQEGDAGFDSAPDNEVKDKYDSGKRGRSASAAWSAAFINYCMLGDQDFQTLVDQGPGNRGSHYGLYGVASKKNTKKLRELAKKGTPWEEAKEQLEETGKWIWLDIRNPKGRYIAEKDIAKKIGSYSGNNPGLVGDIVMSPLSLSGGSKYHGDIRTAPNRIIGGNLKNTVKNRGGNPKIAIVTKNMGQIEKFYNTIYKAKQEK